MLVMRASFQARSFSGSGAALARVGVIGLGNMGAHMATNLIKKGEDVVVFDVSSAAMDALKARGAKVASSPKSLAAEVDTVITMLPSNPHVQQVYGGPDGVFAGMRKGALLIDCSTIDPNVARAVGGQAAIKTARMIDAPVSGGVGGAEAGTLTFMVGGAAEDFAAAQPLLAKMGKVIVHCGAAGTGQVAKLCNNLILGITMIGVSEAMNLGVKLGIDAKVLAGIINTSSGRSWSSEIYNPCPGVVPTAPASRGYTGGFGSALMQKDLGLAADAAKSVNAPLPLGSAAHALYSLLTSHGNGGRDFSVMYEFFAAAAKK